MSCRFCKNKKLLTEKELTLELHLDKGILEGFCGWCGAWSKVKIKYCPMCGGKVEEDEPNKSN